MISFKQLKYALAVSRTLHFRQAADECHISQSALSTALQDLEGQLGFAIFERDNKKVLITPMGKEVIDKAQAVMVQVEDLLKLKQSHGAILSGPMSIGLIPTIAPYLLPRILPSINERYPQLELNVAEEQSHVLVDKVRRGELDAGILALPYQCDGLLTLKFWDENFYWVSHSDLVPNSIASNKTARAMQYQNLILLSEGHCLKDHALAACHLSSSAAHSLSATSLTTLIQLVRGKMGSTLVPETALDQLVDIYPELIKLPLEEHGPHRQLAFIFRPNYPNFGNIDALRKLSSSVLTEQFDID